MVICARGADRVIVFLEDVGEPAYRVDRMVTQLLRTGWFAPVVVLWGVPFGHQAGALTFPLGVEAVLDTASLCVRVCGIPKR